jgi:hypothetical protein
MIDRVRESPGEILRPVQTYLDDSGRYFPQIDRFDKLERLQQFHQPESRSWLACVAGRWEESLEQTERDRPIIEAEFAEDARLGLTSHRVRVVEFPITPYLQWEMHRFKVRVEYGENIRVIGPELVAPYETNGMVPELIFMDSLAMYEVLYDETGVLAGGRKFTDLELVASCLAEVQTLYAQGEDFMTFFEREIAPLPAPTLDPEFSPSRTS